MIKVLGMTTSEASTPIASLILSLLLSILIGFLISHYDLLGITAHCEALREPGGWDLCGIDYFAYFFYPIIPLLFASNGLMLRKTQNPRWLVASILGSITITIGLGAAYAAYLFLDAGALWIPMILLGILALVMAGRVQTSILGTQDTLK